MATKDIKGTQTEKNLVISYLAESTAYSRYTFMPLRPTRKTTSLSASYSVKRPTTSCVTQKYSSNSWKAAR